MPPNGLRSRSVAPAQRGDAPRAPTLTLDEVKSPVPARERRTAKPDVRPVAALGANLLADSMKNYSQLWKVVCNSMDNKFNADCSNDQAHDPVHYYCDGIPQHWTHC